MYELSTNEIIQRNIKLEGVCMLATVCARMRVCSRVSVRVFYLYIQI